MLIVTSTFPGGIHEQLERVSEERRDCIALAEATDSKPQKRRLERLTEGWKQVAEDASMAGRRKRPRSWSGMKQRAAAGQTSVPLLTPRSSTCSTTPRTPRRALVEGGRGRGRARGIGGGTLNHCVLRLLPHERDNMTVQRDVQRAGVRTMMATSMVGVPEYSADPDVLSRVGNVIGETASHEERHVRASDSLPRSTSKFTSPEQTHRGPSIWLWSVSIGTSFCTVGLLGVLTYWHFR